MHFHTSFSQQQRRKLIKHINNTKAALLVPASPHPQYCPFTHPSLSLHSPYTALCPLPNPIDCDASHDVKNVNRLLSTNWSGARTEAKPSPQTTSNSNSNQKQQLKMQLKNLNGNGKNNKNKKNRNTEKQKNAQLATHKKAHLFLYLYLYLYVCLCVCVEKVNKYFTTLSPHIAARKSSSQRLSLCSHGHLNCPRVMRLPRQMFARIIYLSPISRRCADQGNPLISFGSR